MPTKVDVFEEHGEIAALWGRNEYLGRTVISFDRHLDLKPLPPDSREALSRTMMARGNPASLLRQLPVRGVPGAFGLDDFWSAAAIAGSLTSLVWVPTWLSHFSWQTTAAAAISLIPAGPESPEPCSSACCLSVTLCGVKLSVVPPDLLAMHRRRHIRGDVVVDVDLDWLMDEHGIADHDVTELTQLIKACNGELSAMTWSTRSGFLPAEFRRVSEDVADRLGLKTRMSSFLPATPWPENVLLNVHRGIALPQFTAALDISEADGVIASLRGLAVVSDDPIMAATAYGAARALGYRSSWLAYNTGIAYYRQHDYTTARSWLLETVDVDPTDTLAMHARILAARALSRIKGPGAALIELLEVARKLPLRTGVWRTVRTIAEARGTVEQTDEARLALSRIAELTSTTRKDEGDVNRGRQVQ